MTLLDGYICYQKAQRCRRVRSHPKNNIGNIVSPQTRSNSLRTLCASIASRVAQKPSHIHKGREHSSLECAIYKYGGSVAKCLFIISNGYRISKPYIRRLCCIRSLSKKLGRREWDLNPRQPAPSQLVSLYEHFQHFQIAIKARHWSSNYLWWLLSSDNQHLTGIRIRLCRIQRSWVVKRNKKHGWREWDLNPMLLSPRI